MKATELLKKQHEEVDSLFEQIEETDDTRHKLKLFDQLAASLVAHDAIEREIFYPACEEQMGMDEMLGESLVEHGVIEFSLFLCDQHAHTDEFDHYLTVLKEMVDHHVEEEETEFFPVVEKAFGKQELEELGEEMEMRFDEAMAEDFRAPLIANLQEVLSGAMKTTPEDERKPKKAPAKRASAKKTNGKKTGKRASNGARAH